MFANPTASWYHSNQYGQSAGCEHGGRNVRHERWGITCDPAVHYVYRVVTQPDKMTLCDRLMLHSLGVAWANSQCEGSCLGS